MRSCLVLGSGRSGTSMLGGILHDAAYYMGENLYPGRHSNPKGFFENAEINGINEELLAPYCRRLPSFIERRITTTSIRRPGQGQKWLLSLSPKTEVRSDEPLLIERISHAASRAPFAYKDPRFSYTLPVWEKHIPGDALFICVFREPSKTVTSILKECASVPYLASLKINRSDAYLVWTNIYTHILERHLPRHSGRFFFLHFDQVFSGEALPALSTALGAKLKADFVDPALRRSTTDDACPGKALNLYRRLCRHAGYEP